MQTNGGKRSKRGRGKRTNRVVARKRIPRSAYFGLGSPVWPTNLRRTLTYTDNFVVTFAANTGANTTVQFYDVSSMTLSKISGLQSLWTNASTGASQYLSARVLGARVKMSCSNQEAFSVRAFIYLGAVSPANNSLATQTTQAPYVSRTAGEVVYDQLGPLTGNSRKDFILSATNARTLGVSHIRGQADAYTGYHDSTTGAVIPAVAGLSMVVGVLATGVNLTANNGVLCSMEADLDIEFFNLNPKQT